MTRRLLGLALVVVALALFPLAQTHYDLAALYWGRDRRIVEENLFEALRLEPGHAQARKFLEALKSKPW